MSQLLTPTSPTSSPPPNSASSCTDSLNSNQKKAVNSIEGSTLVLAGAGSGKTRVICFRVYELLDRGIRADLILAVTFTNKASKEMAHRINKGAASRAPGSNILVCTFHSLGARILRDTIHALGYSKDFTIYDEEDAHTLLDTILKELDIKSRELSPAAFKKLISHAKMNFQNPDQLEEPKGKEKKKNPSDLERHLSKVYTLYMEKMRTSNAVDFDDLLYLPLILFEKFPEIAAKYQTRWPYILVDEYQDTNHTQYRLLRALTTPHSSLFVVGDPDQSIYSWRGADINNILEFESDFTNTSLIRLEENYRSTGHILNAANCLIKKNNQRYEKRLVSTRGQGEKVQLRTCNSDIDEAEFCIQKVIKHHLSGIPLNDMALFYRTNAQSRLFEEALLKLKVPYKIFGGVGFYQRREIKDILAFLRVALDSNDYAAVARSINLPKTGLGESFLNKLFALADQEKKDPLDIIRGLIANTAYQTQIKINQKQKSGLTNYYNGIVAIQNTLRSGRLASAVEAAMTHTAYMSYLKEEEETLEERKENIESLMAKASEWDQVQGEESNLKSFLEEVSLDQAVSHDDEQADQLNLMTLHNSKGLEFKVVFLTGLEEDLFPHTFSHVSEASMEEERRLCYVGMTRAKEHLYLVHSNYRYFRGMGQTMLASRFLGEIPKEHIDKIRSEGFRNSDMKELMEWHRRKSEGDSFTRAPPMSENNLEAVDSLKRKETTLREIDPTAKKEFNAPTNSMKNAPIIEEIFVQGDHVFHPFFGEGVIQEVYVGSVGKTYRIVFSKDNSLRTLVARYANLSRARSK